MKAKVKNLFIGLVLMAAAMHCVQSIFADNHSLLNLRKYALGQEKMPFQGRVAMMPLLRWGHGKFAAEEAERKRDNRPWGPEAFTPEKVVSYRVALLSLAFLVLLCSRYGLRVQPEIWWLCPSLAIMAFYIGYAARADQNFWYPYDLPHAALFTAACLALLEGRLFLMSAFFLADLPMRETGIYLLPCLLAVGWVRQRFSQAALFAGGLALAWFAVHLAIARRFQANPTDLGVHSAFLARTFQYPHFWPQVASALGYLWLPLAFCWRRLDRDRRAFLVGALPGILVSAVLGIWYETRVWAEWNAMAACLVFSIAAQYISQRRAAPQTPNARMAEPPELALSGAE